MEPAGMARFRDSIEGLSVSLRKAMPIVIKLPNPVITPVSLKAPLEVLVYTGIPRRGQNQGIWGLL